MPDQPLMSDAEIVRALRQLTWPRPIPMTELAARAGVHRDTLYEARRGAITERLREVLTPLLREIVPTDVGQGGW